VDAPKSIVVSFDPCIFEWILFEISKHPRAEEGGKYIGYLGAREKRGGRAIDVAINDFLPGGPRARRTGVEFFPDGEYQERLFRDVERLDPDIEHLGSWHTHHCNGLDTLSPGDIEGYFRTVNKEDYRPNVFVASLVKFIPQDLRSERWIDHFLFVRGDDHVYAITPEVTFTKHPCFSRRVTGHESRDRDAPTQDLPITSRWWFESKVGQEALAADRDLLSRHLPGRILATRKNNQIHKRWEHGGLAVTILYPTNAGDDDLKMTVLRGSETIVSINCGVAHRAAAYAAAMKVIECL